MSSPETYTAFEDRKFLCHGPLDEVVLKVKRRSEKAREASLLIFSDQTGKAMDFNLQGSEADVLKRLDVFVGTDAPPAATGPGRPKLGVVSREVSLLPRHWEWLAAQPGGTSSTLRKLVEDAKRKTADGGDLKAAQERTYKFMSVLAGDEPGYEEALRALYRKDRKAFTDLTQDWPADVRDHAREMAKPVFKT